MKEYCPELRIGFSVQDRKPRPEVRSLNPTFVVAGTRPEAIKLSPVLQWLRKLKIETLFVWSGQHYDYELSRVFFEELGLPEPDINLNVKSGSHSVQTAKIMMLLEKAIQKCRPAIVIAEGDTNTVLAAALTATKSSVPFGHVEAGLRSYDRTMPEEINRIVADSCSELLFAPTELAFSNLTHEGTPLRKIRLTGNTIVDVVDQHRKAAMQRATGLLDELEANSNEYILLTLHRQENTENQSKLGDIIHAIQALAKKHPVIFPIHPRTRNKLQEMGALNVLEKSQNLNLVSPLGYFEFLGLLANSLCVLTDSGGVQEEAFLLSVPTVTLRYNTERPETVLYGTNVLAGTEPEEIMDSAECQIKNSLKIRNSLVRKINPFGDGKAGKKIASVLKDSVEREISVETSDTRRDPYIVYRLMNAKQLQKVQHMCEVLGIYNRDGYSKCTSGRFEAMARGGKTLVRGPLGEEASERAKSD